MSSWKDVGEAVPTLDGSALEIESARAAVRACLRHPNFQVDQIRVWSGAESRAEIILVDCISDHVTSDNPVGIKVREPMALVFYPSPETPPGVFSLRPDFPPVHHLNAQEVPGDASLCLYFEPWSATRRSWTAEKHLRRIQWWLLETSRGNLHLADQPLELPVLAAPMTLVLPTNFGETSKDPQKGILIGRVEEDISKIRYLRAALLPKGHQDFQSHQFVPLVVETSPMLHKAPGWIPTTLGHLYDALERNGAQFMDALRQQIWDLAGDAGLQRNPTKLCVLILSIPLVRKSQGRPETYVGKAFVFDKEFDVTRLGECLGVLVAPPGNATHVFRDRNLGSSKMHPLPSEDAWSGIRIAQFEVQFTSSLELARKNAGISDISCDFKGVQAGVGALGSLLVDIWVKAGWGTWTLVDPDYVAPHNVLRHIAKDPHIGQKKVEVVGAMTRATFALDSYALKEIFGSANDPQIQEVFEALEGASLVVDCTTTLEVPRDLGIRPGKCRVVSAFLNPSGESSVLLAEDRERSVRMHAIEAQYYRMLIREGWAKNHLKSLNLPLWVGAGCREASVPIPQSWIYAHAGLLAVQIQQTYESTAARIQILTFTEERAGCVSHLGTVRMPIETVTGVWTVVWDEGTRDRLFEIRATHLPSETGGVVLGYSDHVLRRLFIVDVLEAPPDSDASRTGFTRGVQGLREVVEEATARTRGIVTNIGEWHAHPPGCPPFPSALDKALIAQLSSDLGQDGEPALMVIVGEGAISINLLER
ncbi:ThiF family adenylyltransferase [Geothrix oryzisoli]|uniref:ThiF family adenylyltransferase n=1 Tax=Geothrix oryzisoli TaxID=2922721 RepID=UPI0023DFF247|nr:ThiF family adenylyltransferase [Geothrix oryzisoli]